VRYAVHVTHVDRVVKYEMFTFVDFHSDTALSIGPRALKTNKLLLFILLTFLHVVSHRSSALTRGHFSTGITYLQFSIIQFQVCFFFTSAIQPARIFANVRRISIEPEILRRPLVFLYTLAL